MTEKLAVVVPVYNEPSIARTLQGLYDQKNTENVHHYVVDNGSIDDTRARIDAFVAEHDDFPLTILEEEVKGTGAASDTGFRKAIDDGYGVVSRTDGDTVPAVHWTEGIARTTGKHPNVQLIGGRIVPLRDEFYRLGDGLLLPAAVTAARMVLAVGHMNRAYTKAVTGANMATRSAAYESVGGFERTSIEVLDEDVEYSLKIAQQFGLNAIKIDPKLEVATSMRRIREYGVAGVALHHLFPKLRKGLHKEIDVR